MNKFSRILPVIALAAILVSCSKDDPDPSIPTGSTGETNSWIFSKMASWYLWPEELPSSPDYTQEYDGFFYSLLSTNRQDGPRDNNNNHTGRFYSYITRSAASTRAVGALYETTHGLDFVLMRYSSGASVDPVVAIVTYVKPGSPADQAGLMRGDRIFNIGGTDMTYSNYRFVYPAILSDSYSDGNPRPTTVQWYRQQSNVPMGPVSISPTVMENDPIYICTRIGNTGYLLYDSFENGGEGRPYDDKLKRSLRELGNIDNLVVDLRYNGGGYVTSCLLLSSIIAPADKAGTTCMTREYNKNHASQSDNFLTISEMKGSRYGSNEEGLNLNLSKVYVLTSGSSASASELLIHTLRGAGVEVYVIGETTHGKNVGMSGFTSDNIGGYIYEMWPVTFYTLNAKGENFSSSGFSPQYTVNELNLSYMNPLGDSSEALLSAALYHINTGSFPATRTTAQTAPEGSIIHVPTLFGGIKHTEEGE